MRFIAFCFLLSISFAASADGKYQPGQMGSYINLCGGGKTQAACMMYLAGYRAGLQDFRSQSVEIEQLQTRTCADSSPGKVADICGLHASELAGDLFEGCHGEGKKLGANVVHQILANYTVDHPESLKEPFPIVYKAAMDEAFPCQPGIK